MRLGKRKEKEHPELKSQDVEGITRLICLSKGQNPLKGICKLSNLSHSFTIWIDYASYDYQDLYKFSFSVHIDGLEWCGVKFFQLSSQWQTHIKHFPVAVFKSGI